MQALCYYKEEVMTDHQIHCGKKFYQDKKTGYWISTTCPKIRAHVWVWKHHHNLVPKGWHVHHKDGDKSNNEIKNLTIMSVSAHVTHHLDEHPERRSRAKEMADKYRHLTKEWHASKEGIEWHRAHGLMTWVKRKSFKIICKVCGSETETKTYHQEFCSNSCKSKWRRKNKLDEITKTCPICQKEYQSSKYSRSKTCGRICGKKIMSNKIPI